MGRLIVRGKTSFICVPDWNYWHQGLQPAPAIVQPLSMVREIKVVFCSAK
jgi:hypothetical protein